MKNSKSNVLFNVRKNDDVGRYAVAQTDLKPGDVIFSETPFAFGPKSDSPPLCLGCYIPVDCSVRCSTCRWPVCRKPCETKLAHRNAECSVFARAKVYFQGVSNSDTVCLQYECITPLSFGWYFWHTRTSKELGLAKHCQNSSKTDFPVAPTSFGHITTYPPPRISMVDIVLLASLRDRDRWNEEVRGMEAHNSKRRHRPIWRFNQINIVNYLRGQCKLSFFSEALIHTVCGILECNAFEARSESGYPIRCIFPKLAILSHNCISNIVHTIVAGDEFTVTVRAALCVSKEEELFSSYTYTLWPTIVRRAHLFESKYFHCSCNRCGDPSEIGTHMSSLLCESCSGTVTAALNNGWMCSNCQNPIPEGDVRTLFNKVQSEIDAADNAQRLEALLAKYTSVLHPQNSYVIIIKSSLIELYNVEERLDKVLEYCRDVLNVINIIKPGYTRIRGVTLHKLFLCILTSISRIEPPIQNFSEKLKEALQIGEDCAKILTLESNETVEGVLGQMARRQYEKLEENFDNIINRRYSVQDILNNTTLRQY